MAPHYSGTTNHLCRPDGGAITKGHV
uniref:Uncharacterized protein n=1 Tax=Anguilla anguilla TaxID=7936 RepID=A0A0E9XZS5_ANGAN